MRLSRVMIRLKDAKPNMKCENLTRGLAEVRTHLRLRVIHNPGKSFAYKPVLLNYLKIWIVWHVVDLKMITKTFNFWGESTF